jgi:ABC-type uncharacterized transport system substrate-binding protein
MITAVSAAALERKDLIIKLATQFRLPVVYAYRVFVAHGGLMSYATDIIGQYKRAVGYVDRILKGEKPAENAGANADEVRPRNQFEVGQGYRPNCPANAARPR